MLYSFNNAAAPTTHHVQYFETGGHRAIYRDGWVATAFHGVPWVLTGSHDFALDKWELYNVNKDFSEGDDLAAKEPAKLKELQALFDDEARKYEVFPLDDRFVERGINPDRPSVVKGRTIFTYAAGTTRIPEGSAPPIYQRSHKITARITVPDEQDRRRDRSRPAAAAPATRSMSRTARSSTTTTSSARRIIAWCRTCRCRRARWKSCSTTRRSRSSNSSKARADRQNCTSMASWRAKATSPMSCRGVSRRPKPWTSAWTSGRRSREDYHDKAPFAFTGTIQTSRWNSNNMTPH